MTTRNAVGRPAKVDMKVVIKLADAIQHSFNVSDACRYAGISRDTYYRHFNNNEVFAEKMNAAKTHQYMLVSYLTLY